MTPNEMVREFMLKFERPVDQMYGLEDARLCMNLITEEFHEVDQELSYNSEVEGTFNRRDLTKELADLIYVCYYTCNKFGLPIDEVFKRVHESNMSKVDNEGKPLLREDGKILKGVNYKPPQLEDLF